MENRSRWLSPRLRWNAGIILLVWGTWLFLQGPATALSAFTAEWQVAVTMVFGSFVAGATSMGGGAVAFPVLTKLLAVAPENAKLFSLAIQSVGMTSASFTIVLMRLPVLWRVILPASVTGAVGMLIGLVWLSPVVPAAEIRVFFTSLQAAFAAVLLITMERQSQLTCQSEEIGKVPGSGQGAATLAHLQHPEQVGWFSPILLLAGFAGGLAASLVGSGIDLILFSVMVLWLRTSTKIATPTSVILMAISSVVGVAFYVIRLGGLPAEPTSMWLAAVPVVVVGAPAGAWCCSKMTPCTISRILIGLIAVEVLTTLLLVPLRGTTLLVAVVGLATFAAIFWTLHRSADSLVGRSDA